MPGFFQSRTEISRHCGQSMDYLQLKKVLEEMDLKIRNSNGFMMPLAELINLSNANGQTPLNIACSNNLPKTVQLLLSYGARPMPEDLRAASNESIKHMLMDNLREAQQEVTPGVI